MSVLRPALVYFALVFGAGFLLGTIRVLLLVPRLGERTAELIEIPFMLMMVFFAARFTVTKWGRSRRIALAYGLIALSMLIITEAALVAYLLAGTGESVAYYFEGRDPVSGTAYVISLLIFGLLPFLLFPRWGRSQ